MFINLILKELKQSWLPIVVISCITALLIGGVVFAKSATGIPISQFVRDPNSISNAPFYNGFYSQLGLFMWFASAALCFFMAHVASAVQLQRHLKGFFIASGAIGLLLGLDDAFLLHEEVFPALGLPEAMVMLLYGVAVFVFLIRYMKFIFTTPFAILGCAFFFLALSVGYDMILPEQYHSYAIEDGAKMAGIMAWFYYFYSTGIGQIKSLRKQ